MGELPVMAPSSDSPTDLIVLRRSELFQLFGRFALPPWPDGNGGWLGADVDCALLAQEIIAAVEEGAI